MNKNYSKAIFGLSAALILVLATTAGATDRYVGGGGTPDYATVQDAIDAASPGETIHVAAGIYTETFVVYKQLTIQGAGSAITIIDAIGGSADYGILLTAGGTSASERLTIKGFTIKNSPSHGIKAYKGGGLNLDYVTLEDLLLTLNDVRGIEIHNDVIVHDMKVTSCEFVSNGDQGLRTASNVIVDGLDITDSTFDGNSYGIYLQGTINDLTILRSSFNNCNGGYGGYMTETGPLTNMLIKDCEFNNNVVGLMVWNVQDNEGITIRNTSFQDNERWGALIWGDTLTDVLIEGCTVQDNDGEGIGYYGIDFFTYSALMTNVAVHFTSITGHSEGGGVQNRNTAATAIVDAEYNWWDDSSGPSGVGGGSGDGVTANVDFEPWMNMYYGNVSLSGGFNSGNFSDIWDLNAGDLVISFTYDGNGLVDTDPDCPEWSCGDHAWSELGIREIGAGNFNPGEWITGGKGVWLSTDFDEAWPPAPENTFDPDPPGFPIQDLDDKLILQRGGGADERYYDLPSSPGNWRANHAVWFDRDGVDESQATMWGAIDGVTYNTRGTYNVVITLHADDDTNGTAYMTINGEDQGFYDPYWHDGLPDLYPAGITFTGDMNLMQVFYGLSGYGATHSVEFKNIMVAGVVFVDDQGPITSNVVADPNLVAVNTEVILTATVDDSTTGGSTIDSAEYKIDDGSWSAMSAQDGYFNGVSECAETMIPVFPEAGVYEVCVRGKDAAGNTGPEECIFLVVYDPTAGFVTGGGWIMSLEGAYTADPLLTGEATFGFISRYKKGANVPTGNTEFQFNAGDLNFHSSSYDWLVVTGSNYARFKGTGTINGSGEYKFMLWAGDGEPDTFRIKIWTEDGFGDETVEYDNGMNQPIGGGSIVIHTKK